MSRCFTDTDAQCDPAERELPEWIAGQSLPGHLSGLASRARSALVLLKEALEREELLASAATIDDALFVVDGPARDEWLAEHHERLAEAWARGEYDDEEECAR